MNTSFARLNGDFKRIEKREAYDKAKKEVERLRIEN